VDRPRANEGELPFPGSLTSDMLYIRSTNRKVDIRLPGKTYSNSHGARPVYLNHRDDKVDLDQQVAKKEVSVSLSPANSPAKADMNTIQLHRRTCLGVCDLGFGV